ncbi:MAG TPA: TraR/DksA C4-type zinc finger protein [Streptosporangiaceae bacterium]|nr:TraR/DksA C4-type zinc finger protein [Streptosporangiaceae bacterium]
MAATQDARAALQAAREDVLARLAGLERDFASAVESAVAANADDEHDPEGATIAFERQHVATLIEDARGQLEQIDAALARIDDGSYGICASCGKPIAAARLAARPAAATCIDCAAGKRR